VIENFIGTKIEGKF